MQDSTIALAETRDLLLAMHDILPMKRHEWEYLAQTHAKKWPGRDVKSIRRKFHALCNRDSLKPSAERSWESRMASHVMFGLFDKDEFGHNPQSYQRVKAIWSAQAPEEASVEKTLVALEENEDFSVVSGLTDAWDMEDWERYEAMTDYWYNCYLEAKAAGTALN